MNNSNRARKLKFPLALATTFLGATAMAQDYDPSDYYSRGKMAKENITLVGTVIKNPVAGFFVIRTGNNWSYRVDTRFFKPVGLNVGDRVRAFGDWKNGALHAGNVRILKQGNSKDVVSRISPNCTMSGTLVVHSGANNFVIRARNGWTYPVRAFYGEPNTLSVGDHVRISGKWSQGVLEASNVHIAYQADASGATDDANLLYDYDTPYRDKRTLTGIVTTNPSGNRFTMRSTNGKTYAVLASNGEPAGLSAGDRVRVYGAWRDGMIEASNVRMLRHGHNPENYNAHVLVGEVTEDLDGDRFVVRVRNGATFRVLAAWGEPSGLSVGDRVRAYGDWKEGMLHASNVRVLNQG